MAAVWETQAAGSMGRMGSPVREDERFGAAHPAQCWVAVKVQGNTEGRRDRAHVCWVPVRGRVPHPLTPGQCEATTWTWIPALGYSQGDGPESKGVPSEGRLCGGQTKPLAC